jgi:hypothetical protein
MDKSQDKMELADFIVTKETREVFGISAETLDAGEKAVAAGQGQVIQRSTRITTQPRSEAPIAGPATPAAAKNVSTAGAPGGTRAA